MKKFIVKVKRFKGQRVASIKSWRNGKVGFLFFGTTEVQQIPETEVESLFPSESGVDDEPTKEVSKTTKKVSKKTTKKTTKKK